MRAGVRLDGFGVSDSRFAGAKMVTIMDMGTEDQLDDFGAFAEEVLNAGGLPQTLLEQLGLREGIRGRDASRAEIVSPEDFLEQVYRFQE